MPLALWGWVGFFTWWGVIIGFAQAASGEGPRSRFFEQLALLWAAGGLAYGGVWVFLDLGFTAQDLPGTEFWQWTVVALFSALTYLEIRYAGYWERLLPWVDLAEPSAAVTLTKIVRALVVLTAAFVAFTSMAYDLGWVGSGTARTKDAEIVPTVSAHYLWHFLDLVPALDVPQTLNWSRPERFGDHSSGVLLLLFKAAVIVPFIRVVVQLTARQPAS